MADDNQVPESRAGKVRGYILCPFCKQRTIATVLFSKKDRLYFKCPIHDVQLMTNGACQQWLHEHVKDSPEELPAASDPLPVAALDPDPAPADDAGGKKPKKKRTGFAGSLEDW